MSTRSEKLQFLHELWAGQKPIEGAGLKAVVDANNGVRIKLDALVAACLEATADRDDAAKKLVAIRDLILPLKTPTPNGH